MSATDFGFRDVPPAQKKRLVEAVFSSVARRYDLMNDLMSLGVHRLWKRFAVALLLLRRGQQVLDVAAGTGDLTALMAAEVGPQGLVVCSDINAAMLERARDRLLDRGIAAGVDYVRADGERLPFASARFDRVASAFGLRNMTDKLAALREMHRVLVPGGCAVVLEFSRVLIPWLRRLYDAYSFAVLPRLGQAVAGDGASYRYLVESIRRHPDQEALAAMMREAGFERVTWHDLSGGIVAIHRGYRL